MHSQVQIVESMVGLHKTCCVHAIDIVKRGADQPKLSRNVSRLLMVDATGQFRWKESKNEVNRLEALIGSSFFYLRRLFWRIVPPFSFS